MNRMTPCFLLVLCLLPAQLAAQGWRDILKERLPELGHRNWIVIADSAYPLQTAAGIETAVTNADQLEVLRAVLQALDSASHVQPTVYTDAELAHVSEDDASGIKRYRVQLAELLTGHEPQSLPHEQIIEQLDEAGKTFRVLLFKTKMTLPYTSVFLRLECGYWNAEAESRLRQKMEATSQDERNR